MTDGFNNEAHLTEVMGQSLSSEAKNYISLPQLLSYLNASPLPSMTIGFSFFFLFLSVDLLLSLSSLEPQLGPRHRNMGTIIQTEQNDAFAGKIK